VQTVPFRDIVGSSTMGYLLGLAGIVWFVYAACFTSFFTPGVIALFAYGTCVVLTQLILLAPATEV